MRFVDTNVLLYRVSLLEADATKRQIATELLAATDLRLSVQVLQRRRDRRAAARWNTKRRWD